MTRTLLFGLLVLLPAGSLADEVGEEPTEATPAPPPDGAASYALCMACHGPDGSGNKALNAPAIAGQPAWYGAAQLEAYRSGLRGAHKDDVFGMQMAPMAKTLAPAAVEAVAKHIESMPRVKLAHDGGGDEAKGEAAYELCVSCHAEDARGIEAFGAPPLIGMQDWYLARQLMHYRNDVRGTAKGDALGAQMAEVAKLLADEDALVDVVAYIRSLDVQASGE